jgi:hypothetical protein
MLKRGDSGFLEDLRKQLYTAVLSDVLDETGFRDQAMAARVRPLDDELVMAGFARTGLFREVFHVAEGENPYELEIRIIDDPSGRSSSSAAAGPSASRPGANC